MGIPGVIHPTTGRTTPRAPMAIPRADIPLTIIVASLLAARLDITTIIIEGPGLSGSSARSNGGHKLPFSLAHALQFIGAEPLAVQCFHMPALARKHAAHLMVATLREGEACGAG